MIKISKFHWNSNKEIQIALSYIKVNQLILK